MSYLETARRILEARRSQNRPDSLSPAKEVKEAKEPPATIPFPGVVKPEPLAPAPTFGNPPEPPRRIWRPEERLIDDARRLGVRLALESDGRTLRQVDRPDTVCDHDWEALRFGLAEFTDEVARWLAWSEVLTPGPGEADESDLDGCSTDFFDFDFLADKCQIAEGFAPVDLVSNRHEVAPVPDFAPAPTPTPKEFVDNVHELAHVDFVDNVNEVAPVPDLTPVDLVSNGNEVESVPDLAPVDFLDNIQKVEPVPNPPPVDFVNNVHEVESTPVPDLAPVDPINNNNGIIDPIPDLTPTSKENVSIRNELAPIDLVDNINEVDPAPPAWRLDAALPKTRRAKRRRVPDLLPSEV